MRFLLALAITLLAAVSAIHIDGCKVVHSDGFVHHVTCERSLVERATPPSRPVEFTNCTSSCLTGSAGAPDTQHCGVISCVASYLGEPVRGGPYFTVPAAPASNSYNAVAISFKSCISLYANMDNTKALNASFDDWASRITALNTDCLVTAQGHAGVCAPQNQPYFIQLKHA
ncbi:hypothetical protein MKEN_01306900 [Mycena kentingensis (nom. inval.)]|nr:hypothetical protein MKEN_01306900 [Mycena kentingensis (nom. inval.)]